MSERRPHWDSELEQAVSAILFDCYENGISEEQVYQAIAAVEDWVYDNFQGGEYDNPVEYTPEERAIQRVRELHKGTPECAHCAGVTGLPDGANVDTCDECCEVMPCPTIRALDGTDD